MPDPKEPLPAVKVPERGKITVSIASKKAPHGFNLVAQVRSLDFSFPKLAESIGVRIPPTVTVEQAEEIMEDLIAAIVWMQLTRKLRSVHYDLFGLLVLASKTTLDPEPPQRETGNDPGAGDQGPTAG